MKKYTITVSKAEKSMLATLVGNELFRLTELHYENSQARKGILGKLDNPSSVLRDTKEVFDGLGDREKRDISLYTGLLRTITQIRPIKGG